VSQKRLGTSNVDSYKMSSLPKKGKNLINNVWIAIENRTNKRIIIIPIWITHIQITFIIFKT